MNGQPSPRHAHPPDRTPSRASYSECGCGRTHSFDTGAGTRQLLFVLAEIRATGARSVLEIGCGMGYGTLLLAAAAPNVRFVGVDFLPRHIQWATSDAQGMPNVRFYIADATNMRLSDTFDVIFGCESFCHMDDDEKRNRCAAFVRDHLRPGGRVVIVDGFRTDTFGDCTVDHQNAMRLAESGFRIRAMPSRAQWKVAFDLPILREQTLTTEALPFWMMGWRLARACLRFPRLLRLFMKCVSEETVGSFISIVTVAHATKHIYTDHILFVPRCEAMLPSMLYWYWVNVFSRLQANLLYFQKQPGSLTLGWPVGNSLSLSLYYDIIFVRSKHKGEIL